jgi:putative DNA primase/helicase
MDDSTTSETLNDSREIKIFMTPKQYECDDIGNKDRFRDYHKENVRYIREQKKWLYYNDGWNYADVFKLTEPVVRNIYKEFSERKTPTKEQLAWAKSSQMKASQRNLLDYASSFMGVSINDFDANPTVINCRNGILDLETKVLSPNSPNQLHLKRTNANYLPSDRNCKRWMQTLNEIFEGDTELIEYIHVALGYSIMGLTKEHCFFLCYGNGRNGKGVLLDTVAHVLGSYAVNAEFEMFLQKDKTNVRELEAVGRLKGQRFVIASETADSSRLKEALIKRLTGGDTLLGTKLHGDCFEFPPTHHIWLACNHLPANKDGSIAMWERVKVIPFNKNFLGEAQEKNLKTMLKQEKDAILTWLVDGAYRYLETGLPKEPRAVTKAIQEYRDVNDKLSVYIRDRLVREPTRTLGVGSCYADYQAWCMDMKENPIAKLYFSTNMEERGVYKKGKRTSKGEVFDGWRFKTDGEEE